MQIRTNGHEWHWYMSKRRHEIWSSIPTRLSSCYQLYHETRRRDTSTGVQFLRSLRKRIPTEFSTSTNKLSFFISPDSSTTTPGFRVVYVRTGSAIEIVTTTNNAPGMNHAGNLEKGEAKSQQFRCIFVASTKHDLPIQVMSREDWHKQYNCRFCFGQSIRLTVGQRR